MNHYPTDKALDDRRIHIRIAWRIIVVFSTLSTLAIILISSYMNTTTTVPRQRRENVTNIDVFQWLNHPYIACNNNFVGYGQKFAVLHHVRFDKISKSFVIPCEDNFPKYSFTYYKDELTILNQFMQELQFYPYSESPVAINENNATATFAIKQVHHFNLFHCMCEWYNVFLISKLLNVDAARSDILLLEDKPPSLMDDLWKVLFSNVTNYKQLKSDGIISHVIWNIDSVQSLLYFVALKHVPYIDEFSRFILNSFGINGSEQLNCSKLHVTIVWRRDYIDHSKILNEGNGSVQRKVKNENELKHLIDLMFPGDDIQEVIMEQMSMKEQLERITQTDILFGMHGAAMTHILFLPKHAGIFETFPNYYPYYQFFKAFARWRGVKYLSWRNNDPQNEEDDFYTRIPPEVVLYHLGLLKKHLCPARKDYF